jgi:cytochrome c-type biogenesis protein CcmF
VRQPHLVARQATVRVNRDGRELGILEPALKQYPTQREPIGSPAVRSSITHDLYLTLMNLGSDGTIGLRAIVTPAVGWIWAGVIVMVLGTGLCLMPAAPPRSRAALPRSEAA